MLFEGMHTTVQKNKLCKLQNVFKKQSVIILYEKVNLGTGFGIPFLLWLPIVAAAKLPISHSFASFSAAKGEE